jgi:tetratricopeptide (TPR) repeat protein
MERIISRSTSEADRFQDTPERRRRQRPIRFLSLVVVLVGLLGILFLARGRIALAYHFQVARQSIDRNRFEEALERLYSIESMGVRSGEWHFLVARAIRRQGVSEGVVAHLAKAQALGWPENEVARQRLLLRTQLGPMSEVAAELDPLLKASLDDVAAEELYEAIARCHLAHLNVEEAMRCLEYWGKWQPDNEIPILWAADLYAMLDNSTEAAKRYHRVLEIRPDHIDARLKLARSYTQLAELEKASELFSQCLKADPMNGDALLGMAEAYRRRGETANATDCLLDALMQELTLDRQALALAELGNIALEEQRLDFAMACLADSIAANPTVIENHQSFAAVLSRLGHEAQAEQHRKIASDLRERKNRLFDAKHAMSESPNDPVPRAEVGRIFLEQGRLDEAAVWLRSALRVDPTHKGAQEGLDQYDRLIEESATRNSRGASN